MPPVGQAHIHLFDVGTQAQKVETGTKARLFDQAERRAAHPLFKARLHHPDLAHVSGQLASAGHIANAGIKHLVDRILQSGVRVLPARQAFGPALADIGPQHTGQQEARGNRFAFAHAAVGIGQGHLHKGAVCTLHHHIQQGVNAGGQAQMFQLRDRRQRMPGLQQFEHLVKQTALRHIGQQGGRWGEGFGGFGFQLKAQGAELGRKSDGTDDAHRVFAVTGHRVADHAQHPLFRVLDAAVVVHHDLRLGVVIHGIDSEIATRGVFVLRTPDVVAQHTARRIHRVLHASQFALAGALVALDLLGCRVVQVCTEGGHLDHLVVTPPAVDHMHDAKAPTDDEGAPKQAFDLLGRGVGGHVEVFGTQAQQQVTHRTAHDVGLKTGLLQGARHMDGAFVHQIRVDAVNRCRHFGAAAKMGFVAFGRLAHQLVDELFDHS